MFVTLHLLPCNALPICPCHCHTCYERRGCSIECIEEARQGTDREHAMHRQRVRGSTMQCKARREEWMRRMPCSVGAEEKRRSRMGKARACYGVATVVFDAKRLSRLSQSPCLLFLPVLRREEHQESQPFYAFQRLLCPKHWTWKRGLLS